MRFIWKGRCLLFAWCEDTQRNKCVFRLLADRNHAWDHWSSVGLLTKSFCWEDKWNWILQRPQRRGCAAQLGLKQLFLSATHCAKPPQNGFIVLGWAGPEQTLNKLLCLGKPWIFSALDTSSFCLLHSVWKAFVAASSCRWHRVRHRRSWCWNEEVFDGFWKKKMR